MQGSSPARTIEPESSTKVTIAEECYSYAVAFS